MPYVNVELELLPITYQYHSCGVKEIHIIDAHQTPDLSTISIKFNNSNIHKVESAMNIIYFGITITFFA